MNMNLRWMIKEPEKEVEERNFDISFEDSDERSKKELELAQDLVKGYIEVVWIGGSVKALVNEEAVYNESMQHNCGFLGNIVFFREVVTSDEDAWFGSLTDEDIRKIKIWALVHANDRHPGRVGMQFLGGAAAEEHLKKLHEHRERQQAEWESF